MKNHYKILGVTESASQEEIKAAFKRLAVLYHPDKHKGDKVMEERFKEVNHSYQVLSDPHRKAQFDLQWNYQRFNEAFQKENRYYRPRPQNYTYRRQTARSSDNVRSTIWAFGITLVIALIVTGVIYGRKYHLEMQYAEKLADRRAQYDSAKVLYDEGRIEVTLEIMANLSPFYSEENDMLDYERNILYKIEEEGIDFFNEGEYQQATKYFETIVKFSPYSALDIKRLLARVYNSTSRQEEAIQILNELVRSDYDVISSLMLLGDIYQVELDDPDRALEAYEEASQEANKYYESVYGKAYPLTIRVATVPKAHYYLFKNLGDLQMNKGDYDKALEANRWAIRVWRDSSELYVQGGNIYRALNRTSQACLYYEAARSFGSDAPLPNFCQ